MFLNYSRGEGEEEEGGEGRGWKGRVEKVGGIGKVVEKVRGRWRVGRREEWKEGFKERGQCHNKRLAPPLSLPCSPCSDSVQQHAFPDPHTPDQL